MDFKREIMEQSNAEQWKFAKNKSIHYQFHYKFLLHQAAPYSWGRLNQGPRKRKLAFIARRENQTNGMEVELRIHNLTCASSRYQF